MTEITYLLHDRVKLYQPKTGYRTAIDSVLLAAACPAEEGRVIDMGAGVGAVSFCLNARVPSVQIDAVEILPENIDLGQQNCELNKTGEAIHFMHSDIRDYKPGGRHDHVYDHAICNPPYYESEHNARSPNGHKSTSNCNIDPDMTLEIWVRQAARLLKPGGSFTIIHLAERIDHLLQAIKGRFGDLILIPIYPKKGRDANRIIIIGKKGAKGVATIRSGLIVHDAFNNYTHEAEGVVKNLEGLF